MSKRKRRNKQVRSKAVVNKTMSLDQYSRMWAAGSNFESGKVSNPYEKVMLVHRCISNLADEIAGLPIMITDEREKRIESGPLYDLLQRPNETTGGDDFWAETVSYLQLDGEVYWITLEYGQRLTPKQIAVVGRSQMEPKTDTNGGLTGWEYSYGQGKKMVLPTVDVAQIRLFNPREKWRGLSPLKAAELQISQNYKSDVFYDSALDNGCDLGGLLTADEINEEQEKQILTAIENRHRGASKAKKLAILAGGLKYQSTSTSMVDMQLVELKGFSNKQICVALKTPPPIVGIIDEANYKMDSSLKIYFNGAIQPLAKKLGNIFTSNYAWRFGKYWVWFNARQHPTAQMMMRETIGDGLKLCEKGATFNDVNKLMDWGLPEYEWGKTWYKPITLTSVEEPVDFGPALEEGKAGEVLSPESVVRGQEDTESLKSEAIEVLKTSIWQKWKLSWTKLEKKFAAAMRSYLYRQRREMLGRLEEVRGPKSVVRGQESGGQGRGTKDEGPEPDIARILFDLTDENKKLKAAVTPLLAEAAALGGAQVISELGLSETVSFTITDPEVISVMKQRIPKLVGINRVTRQRVAESIAAGIDEGETVSQLAQRIRSDFSFSSQRAMTIARTETGGAVSGGRHAGMKKTGVKKKAWLSARNGTVRDTHLAADAKYSANPIPVNETFSVGDSQLMYPGDPAGSAKEVINCACMELPVVEEVRSQESEVVRKYAKIEFLSYEKMNKVNGSSSLVSGQDNTAQRPRIKDQGPILENNNG